MQQIQNLLRGWCSLRVADCREGGSELLVSRCGRDAISVSTGWINIFVSYHKQMHGVNFPGCWSCSSICVGVWQKWLRGDSRVFIFETGHCKIWFIFERLFYSKSYPYVHFRIVFNYMKRVWIYRTVMLTWHWEKFTLAFRYRHGFKWYIAHGLKGILGVSNFLLLVNGTETECKVGSKVQRGCV